MLSLETTAGALKAALATALPAVAKSRRNTIPVLAMARFSGRTLSASDLDMQISVTLPALRADGEACLPVAPLLALCRRLPADQDLGITSDGKTADIVFGTASFRLAALPASDFPEIPIDAGEPMAIDGDGLKRAIGFVMPCVSYEETRYYLNGVHFDGDQAVATDGRRMAIHPLGFEAGALDKAILPNAACKALLKLPPVRSVTRDGTRTLRFSMDGVTMVAKLMDGTYPEWRRVVPSNGMTARFTVARIDMLGALRLMRAILPTGEPEMFVAWRGETMAIAARGRFDGASASDALPIAGLDGAEGGAGFALRYMIDALALLRGADVEISYSGRGDPITLRSDGGGMLVQMPRRDEGELGGICAAMLERLQPREAA